MHNSQNQDCEKSDLLKDASQRALELKSLWPLVEVRYLDNDAKYAENLEVRAMHMISRILTGLDVTVPDAEFVYEGADEIPGRPQEIVDSLLSVADAYDGMESCYEPNYENADARIHESNADAGIHENNKSNSSEINSIFFNLQSHIDEDVNAINSVANILQVKGNWNSQDLQYAIEYAKQQARDYEDFVESQKIIVVLCILRTLIADTQDVYSTLPIFLYINEVCECVGIPRMMFKDNQWIELVDCVRSSEHISTLVDFAAPILIDEWAKHREDVLWDPEVAKKLAKEEDDRKSREALAAKFAHIEGNKESTQALD